MSDNSLHVHVVKFYLSLIILDADLLVFILLYLIQDSNDQQNWRYVPTE